MKADREQLKQSILDLRIYDHLVMSAHLDLLACLIRYGRILSITQRWGFAEKVETSAHLLGYLEAFVAQRFCYARCCQKMQLAERDIAAIHKLVREHTAFDEHLWQLRNRFHHEGLESVQAQIIPFDGQDYLGCFFMTGHTDWSRLPPTWEALVREHYGAIAGTFRVLWNELANAWGSKFGARVTIPGEDVGAPHIVIPPGGTWPASR